MTEKNTGLEQFITWFSGQEDIPLKTRIDMLAHLEKIGHFDEKTIQFIDSYLAGKDAYLQQKIKQLTAELSDNQSQLKLNKVDPQQSRITTQLKNYLDGIVTSFKTTFKAAESKLAVQAESSEKQTELNEVAALKANLAA